MLDATRRDELSIQLEGHLTDSKCQEDFHSGETSLGNCFVIQLTEGMHSAEDKVTVYQEALKSSLRTNAELAHQMVCADKLKMELEDQIFHLQKQQHISVAQHLNDMLSWSREKFHLYRLKNLREDNTELFHQINKFARRLDSLHGYLQRTEIVNSARPSNGSTENGKVEASMQQTRRLEQELSFAKDQVWPFLYLLKISMSSMSLADLGSQSNKQQTPVVISGSGEEVFFNATDVQTAACVG